MDPNGFQASPVGSQPPPTTTTDAVIPSRDGWGQVRESVKWTQQQYRLQADKRRIPPADLAILHNFSALSGATPGTALGAGATGVAVINDGTTISITNTTTFSIANGATGVAGWVDGRWQVIMVNSCSYL